MKKSRVFAPQCPMMRQGHLLVPKFKLEPTDPAGREVREFGELVWLLGPNEAPWHPGVFTKMQEVLDDYDGDRDYLLCLGNPVLIAAMAMYASENSPRVQFLQWSNQRYMPIAVSL